MNLQNSEKQEKDFKGIWIPKEVWLNKDLSLQEKVFLVEIESLDNDNGCFASNKYFSEFFNITKGRCTQIIKLLEKKNMIKIKIIMKEKQIIKRVIKVVNKLTRVVNKLNLPSENIKEGYLENDDDNNTYINNTINISEKKKSKERFEKAFERFWEAFPKRRRKNKVKTQEKFITILKEEKTEEKMQSMFKRIMIILEAYKKTKDWKKENGEFVCMPETFFNKKMYLDDLKDLKENYEE